jgi:hypothetical protein
MLASTTQLCAHIDMFMKGVEEERPEPSKSERFGIMLRTLFDSVIVHSLFTKKGTIDD